MGSRTWGQKVGSTWILNAFPIKVQILKSFTNFLDKTTDKVTNLRPALQFLRFSNYFSHSVRIVHYQAKCRSQAVLCFSETGTSYHLANFTKNAWNEEGQLKHIELKILQNCENWKPKKKYFEWYLRPKAVRMSLHYSKSLYLNTHH